MDSVSQAGATTPGPAPL